MTIPVSRDTPSTLSPAQPSGADRSAPAGEFDQALRQSLGGSSPSKPSARSAPVSADRRLPHIDREHVDPQIRAAGEGMEAMFLDYMMKVMRETIPKNDMDLESPATDIYRSMLDSENSQRVAKSGGIGLADQIIAYLDSKSYTLPQEHAAPKASNKGNVAASPDALGLSKEVRSVTSTGGTHAGK